MIVIYKGSRGKGKTLTMVRDAYKYYTLGYKILANFSLKFGSYITGDEVLALNKSSELYNCVLVLDELQLFFDSRNFSRLQNKEFSNFIQQIRKRNIIILFTTQYSNTIDLRIRQHIDVVAYPYFDKVSNICKVYYFDLTKLEDDMSDIDIKPIKVYYNAKNVFSLYNTYEMLK